MDVSLLEKKIDQWKDELLDLSRRNRLLNFKPTKKGHLKLERPSCEDIFRLLVLENKEIQIEPEKKQEQIQIIEEENKEQKEGNLLFGDATESELFAILYNQFMRSRSTIEEQGINTLFVALGFLKWYEADQGDPWYSPVLMIPVRLQRDRKKDRFKVIPEGEAFINPVLVFMLHKSFGIDLSGLARNFEEAYESFNYDQLASTFGEVASERNGWEVIDDAWLGLFSFAKYVMYKDLEDNKDILLEHPVFRALAGDEKVQADMTETIKAEELDEKVPPDKSFCILDADSSQLEAVEEVKNDTSLVIEGPPGTGKSQTIANLVAELMASGKQVLFVSEKMTALQVVYERLREAGLDKYCLELHSHKARKRAVIEALAESLSEGRELQKEPGLFEIEKLAERRKLLNQFVIQLHTPRTALNLKPHQAYGYLTKYKNMPRVPLSLEEIDKVDRYQLEQWEEALNSFAPYADLWKNQDKHPWRGVRAESFSYALRDSIEMLFGEMSTTANELHSLLNRLCNIYGLEKAERVGDLTSRLNVIAQFRPAYYPKIINSFSIMKERFEKWADNPWRYFSFGYWYWSYKTRNWFVEGNIPFGEKVKMLRELEQLLVGGDLDEQRFSREVKEEELEHLKELNEQFQNQIRRMEELIEPKTLVAEDKDLEDLLFEELAEALSEKLQRMGELERWLTFVAKRRNAEELGLKSFLEQALKQGVEAEDLPPVFRRGFYERWIDFVHSQSPELRDFNAENHERVIGEFRRLDRKQKWIARKRIKYKVESRRPGNVELVERAGSAETTIIRKQANRRRGQMPVRKLLSNVPNCLKLLRPCLLMSPLSLCQYINPQHHQFDVVLFDEASQVKPADAIGAIMRSKQAVIVGDTRQLPPTTFFEAMLERGQGVVEDEDDEYRAYESILNLGSSSLPSKMLKWHYRSRDESLIAFSNINIYENKLLTFPHPDPWGEEVGVRLEFVEDGVYDRGRSRTNRKEASWVAEFVLEHFKKTPQLSLGIVAFSEAQEECILNEIEKLARENQEFGAWLDTGDSFEPFFVKNLESVQGHERDVIFISVGYGKDHNGKMSLNFGPLNQEGGERRLNVAVTRARRRLHLFTSITSDDLPWESKIEGVRLLRNYLRFAEQGVDALYLDERLYGEGDEFESPFEEEVYNSLVREGFKVQPQVGCAGYRIDLAIQDPESPGRFILGIECDGRTYHSSKTARDRDRLRQEILKDLGWELYRIWSRDWFADPDKQLEKLKEHIHHIQDRKNEEDRVENRGTGGINPGKEHGNGKEKAGEENRDSRQNEASIAKLEAKKTGNVFSGEEISSNTLPGRKSPSLPENVKPYHPAVIDFQGPPESFYFHDNKNMDLLVEIARQEGPVHIDIASKRLIEAWGMSKVGQRIRRKVDELTRFAHRKGLLHREKDFLYLPDAGIVIRRNNEEYSRSIEHISKDEIAEAVLLCVRQAVGIDSEELAAQTAKLLGFGRCTDKIKTRIDQAIRELNESGTLAIDNGYVQRSKGH